MMFDWFRRRRQSARLVQADADAFIRSHGDAAYCVARERQRDRLLPDGTTHQGRTPAHWRRVARLVAKMTGHTIGLDTATRMAMDADKPLTPRDDLSPVDEAMRRLLGK